MYKRVLILLRFDDQVMCPLINVSFDHVLNLAICKLK